MKKILVEHSMICYSNNTDSHAVTAFYFNDSVKQDTLCQRPPVPKDVFAGSIILFYGKQPTK